MTENTQQEKTQPVVEGSAVGDLFTPSESEIVEVKYKGNLVRFKVRPMTSETYAKLGDATKALGIDISKMNGLDGMKIYSNFYYPACKVVFPECCIEPRVVDGVSSDKTVIPLKNIPPDVQIDLLEKIMRASGISEEAEEQRKNESSPNL